jgi:hypothetical protein
MKLKFTIFFLLFNFCFYGCLSDVKKNDFNNNTEKEIVNPECEDGETTNCCVLEDDDDGDTITNEDEGCLYLTNSDDDAIPDYKDIDSDNDGLTDMMEAGDASILTGPEDFDGDGIPNFQDRDSDNDGINDGDEDRNHDGQLGNCEKYCVYGSENESEQCGSGQFCEGSGTCDPPVSFQCTQGETSPYNQDTDGDGTLDGQEGTFICNPSTETNLTGRKPVSYKTLSNVQIGINIEAVTANIIITNSATHEEAIVHDLQDDFSEVAGFTIVKDLDDPGSIATNFDILKTRIESVFGSSNVTLRGSGSTILSHEGYSSIVGATFDIKSSETYVPAMRNQLLEALFNRSSEDFTNMRPDDSFGVLGTEFILSFTMQKAQPKIWDSQLGDWVINDTFLIVQGGIVRKYTYENSDYKSAIILADLSNSTGFSDPLSTHENECELYMVATQPVADIIWVVDDSGSMDAERASVKNNAVTFFNRALAYGLDFRMGVVNVGVENNGVFCTGQDESNNYFLTPGDLTKFEQCIEEPWGSFAQEYGSEYGITQGYNAIYNHLPREENNPSRIREEASLVIIYVSDERAEELQTSSTTLWGAGCGETGSGLEYIDPVCLGNQINPTIQLLTQENGKSHAIIGPPPDNCSTATHVGQGYLEITQHFGGQVGSVCQTDLGPTLQIIIEDIVASSSPVVLHHVPISLSIAASKDGLALNRSRNDGFDYRASANTIVFIQQTFDPAFPSEVIVSYSRWVTDKVPVD